jgi:hypothetical protein
VGLRPLPTRSAGARPNMNDRPPLPRRGNVIARSRLLRHLRRHLSRAAAGAAGGRRPADRPRLSTPGAGRQLGAGRSARSAPTRSRIPLTRLSSAVCAAVGVRAAILVADGVDDTSAGQAPGRVPDTLYPWLRLRSPPRRRGLGVSPMRCHTAVSRFGGAHMTSGPVGLPFG